MAQKNTKPKTFPVSEYVFMFSRHKLLIFCCFLLGLAAAAFIIKKTPPGYVTTAKLTIQPVASYQKDSVDNAFFQEVNLNTHLQLILSRPVLETLIKTLASKHQYDEQDVLKKEQSISHQEILNLNQIISQMKKNFRLLIGKNERRERTPAEQQAARIAGLKRKISLKNQRYTRIVEVSVQDTDPVMARDIANTLIETYIQYDIKINQQASTDSFTFLKEQAAEFKDKLDTAEAEFLRYKQQEKLFSLTGIQAGISTKINEYDSLLIEARTSLQNLSTRLKELKILAAVKKPDAVRLRSLLENSVIDKLNSQLIAAELEYSELTKVYRSKHVKIQTIQSTIQNLRKEIHHQVDKELANMRQEKKLLQARANELERNIDKLKKEALGVSSKEQKYLLLERNVETYRQYYDTLMSKLESSSVNSEIRNAVTAIKFVERADKPLYPAKPNKRKIWMFGILGGIFSGIGLALLLEFSDRTVRTEEDVAHYFDLPVVGIIPMAEQAIHRHSYTTASFNRQEVQ